MGKSSALLMLQVATVMLCYLTDDTFSQTTRPSNSDLRLVDGGDNCEGRLEVFTQAGWAQACDNFFLHFEAIVVCGELGCDNAGSRRVDATQFGFDPSNDTTTRYVPFAFICEGYESRIAECRANFASRCDEGVTSSVIALKCQGTPVGTIVGSVIAGVFVLIVAVAMIICLSCFFLRR